MDAILALEHASLEEHLRITFELLDVRGDGTVTRENMEDILKVWSRALTAERPACTLALSSCEVPAITLATPLAAAEASEHADGSAFPLAVS